MPKTPPSLILRLAYLMVLIGAAINTATVTIPMLRGQGSAAAIVPMIPIIVWAIVLVYRFYLVVRFPMTLSSYPVTGMAWFMRAVGIAGIYVGALVAIANLSVRPLMRIFMTSHTESGAEYFVVGMYLLVLGALGMTALTLYEFSRLIGFERQGTHRGRDAS